MAEPDRFTHWCCVAICFAPLPGVVAGVLMALYATREPITVCPSCGQQVQNKEQTDD